MTKDYIKGRFGAGESTNMKVGIPAIVGRSRRHAFSYILKKVEKTMSR